MPLCGVEIEKKREKKAKIIKKQRYHGLTIKSI